VLLMLLLLPVMMMMMMMRHACWLLYLRDDRQQWLSQALTELLMVWSALDRQARHLQLQQKLHHDVPTVLSRVSLPTRPEQRLSPV